MFGCRIAIDLKRLDFFQILVWVLRSEQGLAPIGRVLLHRLVALSRLVRDLNNRPRVLLHLVVLQLVHQLLHLLLIVKTQLCELQELIVAGFPRIVQMEVLGYIVVQLDDFLLDVAYLSLVLGVLFTAQDVVVVLGQGAQSVDRLDDAVWD